MFEYDPEGDDLKMTMNITLCEALLGFTKTFTHLDGRIIKIVHEPGQVIKPGMQKVVANEGMPCKGYPYQKGNLFISFNVEFPNTIGQLTPKARKVVEKALGSKSSSQQDQKASEETSVEQSSKEYILQDATEPFKVCGAMYGYANIQ